MRNSRASSERRRLVVISVLQHCICCPVLRCPSVLVFLHPAGGCPCEMVSLLQRACVVSLQGDGDSGDGGGLQFVDVSDIRAAFGGKGSDFLEEIFRSESECSERFNDERHKH